MAHGRKISVIGLGYVGLPVAVAFAQKSKVIGFDINKTRVKALQGGHDATNEVEDVDLAKADMLYTSNLEDLKKADFHIVAVPTPVDASKKPDLNPLIKASETVGKILKKNDIVVYESTVYPGATEEDCIPVLEKHSKLKAGKDFFVGYSPERINPGDKKHTFTKIMKVVSGQDKKTLNIVADVYGSVIEAGVHKSASIKVAESAKIIENIQRDVNIALMNELAIIFGKLGIDTHDVLAASRTKWNFLNFTPGLVGGHCIGVDPFYLSHKAQLLGHNPEMILSGRRLNDGMGEYVADQMIKGLIKEGKQVKDCIVTVLGLTFKEDIPDLRNTKVIDIIHKLNEYGVQVQIHDPQVDKSEAKEEYGVDLCSQKDLKPADGLLLCVSHKEYRDGGWDLISSLLKNKTGFVYDIKAILDRGAKPSGIDLLRL